MFVMVKQMDVLLVLGIAVDIDVDDCETRCEGGGNLSCRGLGRGGRFESEGDLSGVGR